MSTGFVEFSHVWKKFHYGEVHNRLRDAIPALIGRTLRGRRRDAALAKNEFWALRDVSFTVRPGEALGLIGPNGAGKSTILKLLTRIMRPTSGACTLRGRVGALIEVAAGFHPDLTGAENVYLQGVIMGMPRREIARKFDEIVAFAELEAFIDTPVKRYSTGMEARLGFAIAAHLEPDVLLVDEVLAVGDAAYQAKALEKVTELVRREIPVVIVSHAMDTISSLCSQALLLNRGRVVCAGTPRECIAAYMHGRGGPAGLAETDGPVRIERLTLSAPSVESGERVRVALECAVAAGASAEQEIVCVRVRLAETGGTVFETSTFHLDTRLPAEGSFRLEFELQMNVQTGLYFIEAFTWSRVLGRESGSGPWGHLEVRGPQIAGYAQLNPRVYLERRVLDRPRT
jgi:ABC-type polysaccharide/polyol phosphate transport system ATPase subunit